MSDERHARVFVSSRYAYLGAFEGEGTCGEMPHGRLLRQSIMFDVRRQFACIDSRQSEGRCCEPGSWAVVVWASPNL